MALQIADAAALILLSKDAEVLTAAVAQVGLNTRDEYGRNLLDHIVLQATDPISPEAENPLGIIRHLLALGADASRTLIHMVALDELCFEYTEHGTQEFTLSVNNAVEIIPLLIQAGARISQDALDSAKYNCAPAIQQLLRQAPLCQE